ncbi:MAG: hypothetical protein AB7G13_28655 [Lautropia sp.]
MRTTRASLIRLGPDGRLNRTPVSLKSFIRFLRRRSHPVNLRDAQPIKQVKELHHE